MLPIATSDNLFVDGNPVTGALGTPVPAAWLNAVQAEILAVPEAAGIDPADDNTQLLQGIQKLITNAVASLVATVAIVDISGGASTVLTPAQAGATVIKLNGAVTAAKSVVVPAAVKKWTIKHAGTGSFIVTVTTATGFGVSLWPGDSLDLWCDGTDIYATNSTPRAYKITSIPTGNVGTINVSGAPGTWAWSTSAYYTGYRSPQCGEPVFGVTARPRLWEVDFVGGILSKTAYASLWGLAQENGLVVTSANWVAGSHWFVDLGGDNFMSPDLRNMFPRWAAGAIDPDTANARTLGSSKADTLKNHQHSLVTFGASNTSSGGGVAAAAGGNGWAGAVISNSTGVAETAPKHVAYAPRVHI